MTDFLSLIANPDIRISAKVDAADASRAIFEQSGLKKKLFKLDRAKELIKDPADYLEKKETELKKIETALADGGALKGELDALVKQFTDGGLTNKEALAVATPVIAAKAAAQASAVQLQFPSSAALGDVDTIISRLAIGTGGGVATTIGQ